MIGFMGRVEHKRSESSAGEYVESHVGGGEAAF